MRKAGDGFGRERVSREQMIQTMWMHGLITQQALIKAYGTDDPAQIGARLSEAAIEVKEMPQEQLSELQLNTARASEVMNTLVQRAAQS